MQAADLTKSQFDSFGPITVKAQSPLDLKLDLVKPNKSSSENLKALEGT